ncbi:hypothetical protein EJ07DRAFT_151206 [Lizonia empirigonia]|nr:hypothetical protein EJ07DRAFT_151206 [Lizonia empirigonia]
MEEDLSDALTDGFIVPSLPRIDSASESGDFNDAQSMEDEENLGSYRLKSTRLSTDLEHANDLSPPPPAVTDRSAELVAERLFSVDHLNVILKDNAQLQRFTTFLMRYRAHCVPTLVRYLDSQKALKAIERTGDRGPARIRDFNVVDVVTELLNKEIVGKTTPVMRELVHGLAEVYCLSDPTQEGNPIVFASEEFYNTVQYGSGYAIGKACRFLHGPKTDKRAIERMEKAVQDQQEVAETMIQYQVMESPLKDNRGDVRYFIGARIDVTQLIEGGKTIDSFHQLIAGDRPATPTLDPLENRLTLRALRDFGDLLNDEEKISMRDSEPYILVRPYPSLRIIFTSPSLRIPGLCQSKLEDHIGGPEHVRDSLIEALAQGIGVTAKVSWLTRVSRPSTRLQVPASDDGASVTTSDMESIEGKARWIHCTPLTGSDGKVGVIMIVMMDKQETAHTLSKLSNMSSMRSAAGPGLVGPVPVHMRARSHNSFRSVDPTPERWQPRSSLPSVATAVPALLRGGSINNPPLRSMGGSQLYADYMKEIRETEKRVDSFSSRLRDSETQHPALESMATAVWVKTVNGRGRTKKVGGTF